MTALRITDGRTTFLTTQQWDRLCSLTSQRWHDAIATRDFSLLRIPELTDMRSHHIVVALTLGM